MPLWVRTLLITVSPKEAEGAVEGHREHLRQLKAEGKLRAAGAFRQGEGFLEIYEASDLYEAEAIGRASPLIEGGLATWMIREWHELDL